MTRTKLFLVLGLTIPLTAFVEMLPSVAYRRAVTRAIGRDTSRHPDLYHRPPSEPCRSGYLLMPHAFSQGQQTWDGCWNGYYAPSMSVDFLLPDEDVALGAVVRTR